ncbi:ribonuclease H-like domain-containing protein [Tanacetum coccineum]
MIKDRKYFIGFNESKCYIQDLKLGKIVGTGSESGGLYMFDYDNSGKSFIGLYNFGIVCYVSKELWHCRLGHPSDQILSVLSDKVGFKFGDHVSACDICHKAKQTREPFPLSDHKSNKLGDLVHLDVWGPYKGEIPLTSILALQFCLGTCLDHLGRRHELGELWDCQLGNFTAGKGSGGGGNGLFMGELGLQGKNGFVNP